MLVVNFEIGIFEGLLKAIGLLAFFWENRC
jgi:hypothetical protein